MADVKFDRAAQRKTEASLPAPRMQLRWIPNNTGRRSGYEWLCCFELVIALRDGDVRQVSGRNYLVTSVKPPTGRSGNHVPMYSRTGEGPYCDTPIRDGMHALWDAEQLGGLPTYVIGLDGHSMLVPLLERVNG